MTFRSGLLTAAIALSTVAILWGLAATLSLIFPGSSGEWAVVALWACYVVNIPAGLVSLVVGLLTPANARLRRICLVAAGVALCIPLVASAIWAFHRR